MFSIGITDHLEGPRDQPSAAVFDEVGDLVRLADDLGVGYAWFAEHHAHAHHGHLPAPLLFALHLAGRTRQIRLGTAVVCLNLHHALDVAEQVAVADVLSGGRLAVGFGSGSTPDEARLFGRAEEADAERHARFEQSLRVIRAAWEESGVALPKPPAGLAGRCWVAVNSVGAARVAGAMNFNVLFSHLRTPEQYRQYLAAWRDAGGSGRVAANRPVFVAKDDAEAFALAEPALRTLWRRFQREGKIPADVPEPASPTGLCAHPLNFIVGSPDTVAARLSELHAQAPFDVANVEVRWAGLSHPIVHDSLRRLMEEVMPRLEVRGGASPEVTPAGRGGKLVIPEQSP